MLRRGPPEYKGGKAGIENMNQAYDSGPDALEQIFRGPLRWVNLILIAVNILVFAVMEFVGSTQDTGWMLACGAAYTPLILEGQWYRLFTSMFLHFGLSHLFNNMLLLLFMGDLLEKLVGKWRYLLIYLGSGLAGNLLSLVWELRTGDMYVSAGASGAIFGVVGGVLVLVLKNRGRVQDVTVRRLGFMVLLTIYYGFQTVGVNNAAHIGGILGGMLLTWIICPRKYRRLPKRKRSAESGW